MSLEIHTSPIPKFDQIITIMSHYIPNLFSYIIILIKLYSITLFKAFICLFIIYKSLLPKLMMLAVELLLNDFLNYTNYEEPGHLSLKF